jgi:hypothetical protein
MLEKDLLNKYLSMNELEALIEVMKEATKLLVQYKEAQAKRNEPKEYLDSTGAVINQPQVVLADRITGALYPATFKNGVFTDLVMDELEEPAFEMDYEMVMNNYTVVQTGDRIACYRRDCLFNKYGGCTIKPMLTIGANWKVICGSMIDKKGKSV